MKDNTARWLAQAKQDVRAQAEVTAAREWDTMPELAGDYESKEDYISCMGQNAIDDTIFI